MRRFRFTIAGLAAAVAFLAIAVAALPEATPLWDSLTFTLTLGLLVVSILRVVHLSRERCAFWLGLCPRRLGRFRSESAAGGGPATPDHEGPGLSGFRTSAILCTRLALAQRGMAAQARPTRRRRAYQRRRRASSRRMRLIPKLRTGIMEF